MTDQAPHNQALQRITLPRFRMRSALLWTGLVVLVALGVITAVARVLTIADITWVTKARLAAAGTLSPGYVDQMPQIEQRFADSAPVVLIHVVTGGAFLSHGLLQFSTRIRNRHLRFHRWSGRFLVTLAIFAGVTGLWLGVVAPYSSTERLPTAAAGALFLIAPAIAVIAIRRGDIARHREWMIRFFALGVGIVVIRLAAPVILWLLSPAPFRDIVGLTFWAGWVVSLTIAEVWIRSTRAERRVHPSVAPLQA